MNKNEMVCTVCQEPKNELTPSRSQLLPQLMLLRCSTCNAGKKEPRWAILLTAKTMGNKSVRRWVAGHLYVGEPIKLSEVV